MKNIFYLPTFLILALSVALLLSAKAFAFEEPVFPNCINPQGLILASYDTGVHGIIGDYSIHTGKDTVYKVSDTTVMQCFCDEMNTNGIQTNWWNASDLTEEQVEYFEEKGWMYTTNGADWGLDQAPYLAKNTSFDCKECVTPSPIQSGSTMTPLPTITETEISTPSATPTPVPSLTAPSIAGESGTTQSAVSQPESHEAVLAASTLASTGNVAEIVLGMISGLISLSGGIILKRKRN